MQAQRGKISDSHLQCNQRSISATNVAISQQIRLQLYLEKLELENTYLPSI